MDSRADAPRGGFPFRLPARVAAAWGWLNLVIVLAIVALDWMTPAGVVVGILLGVPIILTSMHDSRRQIWVATAVAVVGFLLAAGYGRGPIGPEAVWVPNRIFAFLTLPASAYLAFLLQSRRKQAESARDAALSARDLNRLLISLLAHDLRSPLALATQGLDYVTDAVRNGQAIDTELIADLRARLQRSLRAVEVVLTVTREGLQEDGPGPDTRVSLSRVGPEVAAEVDSFASEARHLGKTLVTRLDHLGDPDPGAQVDALVLRQTLAILLDNAIRYAVPGEVTVAAAREGGALVVRVCDQGPDLSAARTPKGSGLGLELARSLVGRVGGRLEVERQGPDGTELTLRLPVSAA